MLWHDCQETSTHESSWEFDSWIWTEHGMRRENVWILTFGSRFVALCLRHRHLCNLQPLRVWVKKGLCPWCLPFQWTPEWVNLFQVSSLKFCWFWSLTTFEIRCVDSRALHIAIAMRWDCARRAVSNFTTVHVVFWHEKRPPSRGPPV